MYQALYRKYRPKAFSDVIGQDHITQTLRRQVETGHTSHAYLFVGTRGTGKTTCAKILSRALNCEHPVNGDPCNECASCRGIESGSVLDVVEIDAASNNGVDNIRAIRDEAVFSPASVKKRVYIIDEVHMLSNSAFNALLKILEEPPEHLVFILATTELNKVPATILSRCQRFSFKRIMPEDIVKRIKYIAAQEHIDITDGAASLLARLGDGSMRDALSLFDQCLSGGTVTEEYVLSSVGLSGSGDTLELWEKLKGSDLPSAFGIFQKLYLGGADPSSTLSELLSLIRDMMIIKISSNGASGLISGAFSAETLAGISAEIKTEQLITASEEIQETISRMGAVRDKRTAAEVCLIKISEILSGRMAPAPVYQPAASAPQKQSPAAPNGYRSHPEPEAPNINTAKAPPAQREAPKHDEPPAPWEDNVPPPWDSGVPAPWEEEPPQEHAAWPVAPSDMDAPPEDREAPPQFSQAETPAQPLPSPEARQTPPPQPVSSPSGANLWDRILTALNGKIDMPQMMLLSSSSNNISATESGGNLKIITNSNFVMGIFDTPQMKNTISQAAAEALGHPAAVNVAFGEVSREFKEDKLDELSRFNNIKFK